jgi:dihydropyrimidine dehydrogenase (NAD+) subunit PreT
MALPPIRSRRSFVEDELNYILSIGGIKIQYGQALGRDISLDQLRREYDAVFLAFGVGVARRLDIPGEDLSGVVDAIHFIYDIRANGYPSVPVGDKVAVIGMGMTAIDAATPGPAIRSKRSDAGLPAHRSRNALHGDRA